MNSKGQGPLDYLLVYGGILLILAIIVGVLVFIVADPSRDEYELASENFCKAWAEERTVTYIDGYYSYFIPGGQQVDCQYSSDADVFDGGVSPGKTLHKSFNISEEDLLEWENKGESKDCCEVYE